MPTFDPGQVFLGSNSSGPYLPTTTMGGEAVRASGSGPFDPAYRQNLATYAGGQFFRPGGNLSFDPTGSLFGNPTGGGSDPVQGLPTSLLGMALGGSPFSFTPQPPDQPSTPDSGTADMGDSWKFWLNDFNDSGRMLRTY